jgi:curved DNA-binding protein
VKDLYAILGVAKNATADEIKRAYRKLAMQHHPDRGGDQTRFQEVQQAYDVLGDESRRAQYDSPQPQNANFGFGGNFQDIFDMFARGGGGFGQSQQHQQRRGHVRLELWIGLEDVARGGRRTISMGTPSGVNAVEIDIPVGVNHGDHVQYAGLAPGGQDLVITFRVSPHADWTRSGPDLMTSRTVLIWDLILGGEIQLHDLYGAELTARVPPMTQPGTKLRLKNRGLRNSQGQMGDILVQLHARLPDQIPPDILAAIQQHRQ